MDLNTQCGSVCRHCFRFRASDRAHGSRITVVVQVEDEQAFHYVRRLAREEGLLLGPSSGANVAASIQVAARLVPGARLLTVFCDTGFRYFSVDGFGATESVQE